MKVLIVDDDQLVRQSMQACVESWGASSLGAAGLMEALSLLGNHDVDLVITDINMPGGDGYELLRAVKSQWPQVEVVIFSGRVTKDHAVQALNHGAFALLQKPVLNHQLLPLLEQVGHLLRRRQESAEAQTRLRENAEEQRRALNQEQQFSNAIFKNAPIPICLIDWEARVWLTNPIFREIFGDPAEQLEGRLLEQVLPKAQWDVFVPPEAQEGFSGALTQSPGVTGAETRYFQVKIFPVSTEDSDVVAQLTCVLLEEVTLRVKSERQRGLHQWRLQEIYGFMALTRGMGSTEQLAEILARYLADGLARFNPVSVQLRYQRQVHTFGQVGPGPEPYLRRAVLVGQEVRGELALYAQHPVEVEEQEQLVAALLQEMSHRIEAGELELQLIHAGRLHSLGEMAAGVAHELNQPLTGIRTFAEGTLYGLNQGWETSPDEVRQTLADIVAQVDRMSAIIDQMRSFARRGAEEMAVVFRVEEVVQKLLALVGAQLRVHQVEVRLDLPADLPSCRGWPNQVEQVLLNLVVNARQAMDDRDERRRTSAVASESGWRPILDIQALVAGDVLKVGVTDNGGGIPEEIVGRVFEPFFTSKKAGEGTGLGLSISRNIARNHGGDLEVKNHPTQGCTFWLSLPVAG